MLNELEFEEEKKHRQGYALKSKEAKSTSTKTKTVSVRIAPNTLKNSISQLAHDLREKEVDYLRDTSDNNLVYFENKKINMNDETYRELKQNLQQSAKEQKAIHEKITGRKSQIKNYFIDGIITFSEEMKQDYQTDKKKFIANTKKSLEHFSKKYNSKLLVHTIHLDEKTPHIHFKFENVNRGTGMSIQRYIKKQNLSDLQTEISKNWSNMDYNRGQENSKAKHYSVKEAHEKERTQELDKLIEAVKEQKRQVKQLEITAQEKKQELDKFDELMRKYKNEQETINDLIALDYRIKQDTEYILKHSKKIIGRDEAVLKQDISDYLTRYSKINDKTLNEQKAQKLNESLSKELESAIWSRDGYKNNAEAYKQNAIDYHPTKNENKHLKKQIALIEKHFKINVQELSKQISKSKSQGFSR
jgi:hypothetical protein